MQCYCNPFYRKQKMEVEVCLKSVLNSGKLQEYKNIKKYFYLFSDTLPMNKMTADSK